MRAIFLMFCLLVSLPVTSQVDSVAQVASRKPLPMFGENNLSLGLNTQFLFEGIFKGPISTPLEILVRKRVGKSGAIRLRTWGLAQTSNRTQPYGNTFERNTDLGIAAGKEWHRAINHKWGYYYGAELGIGYRRYFQDSAMIPLDWSDGSTVLYNREVDSDEVTTTIVGILGGNYSVNNRFSISAEVGFGISHCRAEYHRETIGWVLGDSGLVREGGRSWTHYLDSTYTLIYSFFPKIRLHFNL
jgi:hypothetical protein